MTDPAQKSDQSTGPRNAQKCACGHAQDDHYLGGLQCLFVKWQGCNAQQCMCGAFRPIPDPKEADRG